VKDSAAGLSLIVPCMNEIAGLPRLRERLDLLRREVAPRPLEVIFVDDGSSDGTAEALAAQCRPQAEEQLIAHPKNRGLGAALTSGLTAARHPIAGSIDADLSYDPRLLLAMLPRIEAGADMVTASPYHPEGRVRGVPAWRLFLSRGASWGYRRLLRTQLHTYTSCVRLYRTAAVRDLRPQAEGFVGVIELLARLDLAGGRIEEIPAELGLRETGVSKMRTLRTIRQHLGLMARLAAGRLGDRHG
jgi:dolichol-phosphate mannosyltransferase